MYLKIEIFDKYHMCFISLLLIAGRRKYCRLNVGINVLPFPDLFIQNIKFHLYLFYVLQI